ncbi:NTP/NDP exchange transporter [Neopusillimonas maritima]|uniref:MFS transporter n=1 Tax=Neopusillimonas maritima TaxID=2026239 RepID=A0A3A1YUN1_9BURK|nr:MFS transporter [Neopusillimonas maritima]RIY41236.1 MFS transporter [Neopusillimonas maritima]
MAISVQTFLQIKRKEVWPVLLAGLFFFCVLAALMVVRPAREALGLQRGIETVRWLFLGTLLLTLLVNPLFGVLVSRFRRRVFVSITYLFFAAGLLVFYALLVFTPAAVGQTSGMVFYVWFSVFNLFATMLFWAFMVDSFTPDQSERLFGAVAVGGTLGALFGPWLAGALVPHVGTAALLPVASGFLMAAVVAAHVLGAWVKPRADRVFGTDPSSPQSTDSHIQGGRVINEVYPDPLEERLIGGKAWDGFKTTVQSPYLLGIAGYVLLVAIMATLLYFTRLQMVSALVDDTDGRTVIFARIDFITQATTLILQALITGHIMRRLGVAVALVLLPVTVGLGFVGLAVTGTLTALIVLEAAFRAVQRGIMRPARETLFTVVPRAQRYKSKAFIDTFVYRGGDAVGAQTEGLLGRLGMGLAGLAAFALPLAVLWAMLGIWLGWMQRKRKGESHDDAT